MDKLLEEKEEKVRVELQETEDEFKWLVFANGKRGSVGKLVAELKPPDGREAFIKNISLRPAVRGNGTSLVLLERCKKYFKEEKGCKSIALEAEEDMSRFGKLVSLYTQAGFKIFDGITQFKILYNGDETFRVVPMRCFLTESMGMTFHPILSSTRYARAMAEEFYNTSRERMTVFEAIEFSGSVQPAVQAMKIVEEGGHPEWVQFLALIQHLGALENRWAWSAKQSLNCYDVRSTKLSWIAELGVDLSSILSGDDLDQFNRCSLPLEMQPTMFEGMGLSHSQPTWGNDEYLFHLLQQNECLVPPVAANMVRYRSLYPLIEKGLYNAILSPSDSLMIRWVKLFAKISDQIDPLGSEWSKICDNLPSVDETDLHRAKQLVEKFCPEPWAW